MKSQNEMVLDHLRKHGTINLLVAEKLYGVVALHSRISDLRARGHVIETCRHTVKNRFGKKISAFEYKLIKEAN